MRDYGRLRDILCQKGTRGLKQDSYRKYQLIEKGNYGYRLLGSVETLNTPPSPAAEDRNDVTSHSMLSLATVRLFASSPTKHVVRRRTREKFPRKSRSGYAFWFRGGRKRIGAAVSAQFHGYARSFGDITRERDFATVLASSGRPPTLLNRLGWPRRALMRRERER